MDINFNKLFDVDIFHEYYKDGISKDFEIAPTAECKKLLLDYRLLFRKTQKGFSVSYSADSDDNFIIPVNSQIKLSFTLTSKNPYLLNYSNLPFDKIKNIVYYLTNYNCESSGLTVLHKNEDYISIDDRVNLKSDFLNWQEISEEPEIRVNIKDISDNTVVDKIFKTFDKSAQIYTDLSPFTPGKFIMQINGGEETELYSDKNLLGKNVFGIVEIFWGESYKVESVYEIKIPLRKTFWKYNVILKQDSGLSSENISVDIPKSETDKFGYSFTEELIKNIDSDPKIMFDREDAIELSGNPVCVPFLFSQEMPLKEEIIKGIRLVKINGNGDSDYGHPLIENLPNPSVNSIKSNEDFTKVFSEINIYI